MVQTIINNWQIVVVLLLVAIGVIGFEFSTRRWKRIVQEKLRSRPQLSSEEFGKAFFGETANRASIAKELREILARHLPISIDGLQPEDKFQDTLKMEVFDSLSTIEVVMEMEERFAIKLLNDNELKSDMTFRQLVDYIEHRVAGR
jgi:acyl carrier protein